MRPFLLLATRAEDAAADDEYAAFLRFSGLDEPMLRRVRLERAPLPELLGAKVAQLLMEQDAAAILAECKAAPEDAAGAAAGDA